MFLNYPKASFLAMLAALIVSGCSNFYWPKYGRGGMAEDQPHEMRWHFSKEDIEYMDIEIMEVKINIASVQRENGKLPMTSLS